MRCALLAQNPTQGFFSVWIYEKPINNLEVQLDKSFWAQVQKVQIFLPPWLNKEANLRTMERFEPRSDLLGNVPVTQHGYFTVWAEKQSAWTECVQNTWAVSGGRSLLKLKTREWRQLLFSWQLKCWMLLSTNEKVKKSSGKVLRCLPTQPLLTHHWCITRLESGHFKRDLVDQNFTIIQYLNRFWKCAYKE